MSTKEKELQKKFEEECEYASLMRKGNRFAHMRYHYLIALKLCLELRSIYKSEGDEKNYEAWGQVVDAITKNIEVDYDYKEIKEIDAFSIFTKSVYEVRTNKGSGTCFVVDYRDDECYLITNRHVVDKATIISVISKDKKINAAAQIVDKDDKHDIALIKMLVRSDDIVPVTFANIDDVTEGVKLYIVGNRSGLGLGFISGYVASFLDDNILMSIKTEHGTSGSSVFDCYGSVVGINCGILGEVPFCISGKVILDYLKKFKVKVRKTTKVKYK